jgi:putative ABC transport system permease protein
MAWREVRASWRRLVLFFLCIALGVGAMVSLRSFTKVFSGSLANDSRALLSADVRVENTGPWSPEQIEILTRHGSGPDVLGRTRMIETQTIVRVEGQPEARPVMVQLRGVEPSFPLRGRVRLANGAASHALVAGRGALLSPSLFERLQVKVGDRLVIGTLQFTIRGRPSACPATDELQPIAADPGGLRRRCRRRLTGFGSASGTPGFQRDRRRQGRSRGPSGASMSPGTSGAASDRFTSSRTGSRTAWRTSTDSSA